MKNLYILILLLFISCTGKIKEKKASAQDTIQQTEKLPVVKAENDGENGDEHTIEDISGVYELIAGKTYIIGDESYKTYKAAIVIEKLSENDFGFYSVDKVKEITPLGGYGVLRRVGNIFHELRICDGEDVGGYIPDDFTTGLYLHNEVGVYKKGDTLGIVQYGGNFRKYMRYKKKKSNADFDVSLVKTMRNTKEEYQEYLKEYKAAKNHNTDKLLVKHYLNGDEWLTEHLHNEDYASFEKTHFYQNSYQEGKFIRENAVFENQFKNQVENTTLGNDVLENLNFEDVIHAMDTKPLPRIENTNFDDFIEPEDYKNVAVKTLQLQKLYSDFNEEDSGFRAISCYRLEISKTFYSVVVTILKNEHEMETLLINYDLNGEIIDSKVVSYDEIAEGQSRIESRISENILRTNYIFWDLIKEIEQKTFTVNHDGTVDKIDSKNLNNTLENYPLILDVLEQLKLNPLDIKTDLVVSKVQPNKGDETIIVIPEIVEEDHEYNFELNSHVVLVNTTTGKITHSLFETPGTNQWVSDAVQLTEIKIDTTPYLIAEEKKAFGISVFYYGHSRANPYSNEIISLYVESGNTLKKVLSNYTVMEYGGEWDMECSGEFLGTQATLTMSTEKTNEYFDIIVKNTVTQTKNYEDKNGDCDAKEEIKMQTTILKFEDNKYKNAKELNK